jgi:hypothetical protein
VIDFKAPGNSGLTAQTDGAVICLGNIYLGSILRVRTTAPAIAHSPSLNIGYPIALASNLNERPNMALPYQNFPIEHFQS